MSIHNPILNLMTITLPTRLTYLHDTLRQPENKLQYPLWTVREIQLHRNMARGVVAGMVGVRVNKIEHIGYPKEEKTERMRGR